MQKLLEDTGVALLPGSVFGRPEDELTARFAYVDFDGAKALAAVEIFRRIKRPMKVSKYKLFHIVEAIDLICDGLNKNFSHLVLNYYLLSTKLFLLPAAYKNICRLPYFLINKQIFK